MVSSDILNLIDSAIDDYALSDDAMRWSPEPPAPRTRGVPMQWPPAPRARVVLVVLGPEQREAFRAAFLDVERQLNLMVDPLRRAFAELHQAFQVAGLVPPEQPVDPMQRALEARRNRNTGPPARQRAPRRIDPRRAR